MNRSELQQLAEIRLRDAKALLVTGENDAGAYYMAGYAVECALKAVIAKKWVSIVLDWSQDQLVDAYLEAGTVGGVADYLIAQDYGYVETPLLCAIEAKRDDFEQGETQCIAEMAVCQQNNARDGHDTEVHGIVSNGQGWVFYRLTRTPEVFVSGLFTMNRLPELLGAIDHVIAACADNIP